MIAAFPPSPVLRNDLVLGIDGGASHTVALLADAASGAILGRGESGPSNIQAVGETAALRELDAAVSLAFEAADTPRAKVAAACLGLAGIDVGEGQDVIGGWADSVALAGKLSIANDATLLFAAGTPEGWGLAIIAGTGSIAFTLDAQGNEGRAGGWGYMLGDEGSAFRVGLNALRAVCRAADGAGPATSLLATFLAKLGSNDPRDFIPAVYRGAWDKAAIAGLAPVVLEAAEAGDTVAHKLIVKQATELGKTAACAVQRSNLPRLGLPIAVTGGLLVMSEFYRRLFLEALIGHGLHAGSVGVVEDPAIGAVVTARKLLSKPEEISG